MKTKIKTNRSAAKRFSFTSKGKVKYKKQGLRHILTNKNRKRKRRLRKGAVSTDTTLRKNVKRMLPNG